MKNTYIIVIILIILAAGAVFVFGKGKKVEAPATNNNQTNVPDTGTSGGDGGVACTMEAKLCPDGKTYVGRSGPKCEFEACPGTGGVSTAPVKEFTVTGTNFAFSPSSITVNKGDRVKITFNNTNGFHDFMIAEFGVASKQAQSPNTEVLEFTADKVGSFEYYCSVGTHRAMGMKGTLVVK